MRLDAFVLAGGRSRRMGSDKARLPFPGVDPMAVHVARVLRPLAASVALVRRGLPDGLPWWDGADDLTVVYESDDLPAHALTGLATACGAGETPFVLVAPCDLPFLTASAVQSLLEVAAAQVGSRAADPVAQAVVAEGQPLLGVYPRALGPVFLDAAVRGRAAREVLASARAVAVGPAVLRNVNSWPDTGRPHPLDALHDRVDGDPDILDAEVQRARQRGVVYPPR